MEKLIVRLEFKGAATVKNCQEVLDMIMQHQMVKSAELVINYEIEKKDVKDAVL